MTAITVTFEKPDKKNYHYEDPKTCPPIVRGDGCYGDCSDCFSIETERYERRKAVIDNNKMSICEAP